MAQKEDLTTDPPCHTRAVCPKAIKTVTKMALPITDCAIQSCLAKNSYKEDSCRSEIDALYDCCNNFYSRNGDEVKSVSCPKASLLRLKMKQRMEEHQKNGSRG